MDANNNATSDMTAKGSLLARAGAELKLVIANYHHMVAWRRPQGCQCEGCHAWRTIAQHLYEFTDIRCRNAFKAWEVTVPNLTTTEGKNDMLTQYFKGSSYSATWYVGLVDNTGFTSYAAGDTAAKITTSTPTGGTNSWQESTAYSAANRVTWTGGTAASGSIDNSGSAASFSINATVTVRGLLLVSTNTKGGTTGKLFGVSDITTARALLSGDTFACTVTNTLT